MSIFKELQNEVQAAKKRTDSIIATAVKQGKFQVQKVTYNNNGSSNIEELSDYVGIREAIEIIKSL